MYLDSFHENNMILYLRGHDNKVSCLAKSGNGLLASGQLGSPGSKSYDSPVFLWNIGNGKRVGVFEGLK